MTEKQFLDHAYGLDGTQKTRKLYADWAASYDSEIAANGYATPGRCAEALAHYADKDSVILDVGCGTGLSGLALAEAGFSTIDGCDLTPEMLAKANDLKLYRRLWVSAPEAPLDFSSGPYGVVAAIGVIGSGAAPVSVFNDITVQLEGGGHFVFSFNDHTLEDPVFETAVADCVDSGAFELLFKEYGPHLPGRDLNSNVYVLKKR